MTTLNNIVVQIEHEGNKILVAKVEGDLTIGEFLRLIAEKIGYTASHRARLSTKENEIISPSTTTLLDANIKDGEFLIVDFERRAGKTEKTLCINSHVMAIVLWFWLFDIKNKN